MTVLEDVAARVVVLLESLGETSEEVAAGIRRRGLTGVPGDSCRCPLARLIRAEVAGIDVVGFGVGLDPRWRLRVTLWEMGGEGREVTVPTPAPVDWFVLHFDGHDPDLADLRDAEPGLELEGGDRG